MIFVWIIVIILIIMFVKRQQSQVPGSKNWTPMSKKMYDTLYQAGVGEESLREFVDMENQLILYERDSVCNLIDRSIEAEQMSQKIKDRFKGFDFRYHQIYLKQTADPSRTVDKHLTCLGVV